MSTTIGYPFGIIAKDKDTQMKICTHMNQMSLAELDKCPDSTEVKITPISDNPLPLSVLANLLPLARAFRSSYIPGLQSMITREAADQAAAKKSGGHGRSSIVPRTP